MRTSVVGRPPRGEGRYAENGVNHAVYREIILEHSSTCLFAFFLSVLTFRNAGSYAADHSLLFSDGSMLQQSWLADGWEKAAGREDDEGEADTFDFDVSRECTESVWTTSKRHGNEAQRVLREWLFW